jgi:hypothetical protein
VEELAAALRASGLDVTVEGSVLLLGPHEAAHVAVRDAVADLALGLRRLEPRGRTLEDVYMGTGE